MQLQRVLVLSLLAALTIFFLGAAFLVWQNEPSPLATATEPTPLRAPSAESTVGSTNEPIETLALAITDSGIQGVTARQLRAHQMQIDDITEASLNLTHQGEPVPYMIAGDGDEATLYFYAEATSDTLRGPSVYRLESGTPGAIMQQQSAAPKGELADSYGQQTHIRNKNLIYTKHAPGQDMWMESLLFAGQPWEYRFDAVEAGGQTAELIVTLLSNTDSPANPDHHVQFSINGHTLSDAFWDGISYEIIRIPLETGILSALQPNVLTIYIPGDVTDLGESVYIDTLELHYTGPLLLNGQQKLFSSNANTIAVKISNTSADNQDAVMVFDISNPGAPIHLTDFNRDGDTASFSSTGTQYAILVAGQAERPQIQPMPAWDRALRDLGRGADYIAIIPSVSGFKEAIDPLLTYRTQLGLRVSAVALDQIYDEFSYGQESPDAIRAFLTFAAENWQPPAPRYVLLVGDATQDIRNLTIGTNRNHIPAPLVTSMLERTAADTWYTWDAAGVPQMAIGRFPSQTIEEIQTLVAKTVAYESQLAQHAEWSQRALLIADDQPQFDLATSELAETLQQYGYTVYQLHMSQNETIHYDIMSAINQGVGLINYTGSGSERMWGDEGVLDSADAASLNNGNRLPLLTTFTTRNGAFADPRINTLAETLLHTANGGVVAVVAPSGSRHSPMQIYLANDFYTALLNPDTQTIGDALLALQKEGIGKASAEAHILPTINILGDPALRFQLPTTPNAAASGNE